MWADLREWYENGGKEALMYEMLHRDLSKFNYFKAPQCKALSSQLRHSLVGVELFAYKLIEDGTFDDDSRFDHVGDSYMWSTSKMYKAYIQHNPRDKMTQMRFSKDLKHLLAGNLVHKRDGNYFKPKSPKHCAKHFHALTGVNIESVLKKWGV